MRILFFFLFVSCFININAQINADLSAATESKLNESEKQRFREAESLLAQQKYLYAQNILDSLYINYPDDEYLNYLAGLGAVYNPLRSKDALQFIQNAFAIKDLIPDYDYFAGLANERNEKYDDALRFYEFHNRTHLTAEKKSEIKHRIVRCKLLLEKKEDLIKIHNIGKPVNSASSEFGPVLPGNESFMVFTMKDGNNNTGKKLIGEDVFISYRGAEETWSVPVAIESVNSTFDDVAVCVSSDGSKLIIFRSNGNGNGELFLSTRSGKNWTTPEKMKGVNTAEWEGSACFTPDGFHIIFSSERSGGKGGKDLWSADLLRDGSWGNVQNLGENINSIYDEESPFITADGLALFFCSNNKKSFGGFDVFRCDRSEDGWSLPENIGKPVNTSHDEKYYTLSADGKKGYFSSDRAGSTGQHDIYIVEQATTSKPIALIQVKGIVTKDSVPSEAVIRVKSKITHKEVMAVLSSNSATGEFLIHLPAGDDYELIYNMPGFNDQVKQLNSTFVDSFYVLNVMADFLSDNTVEPEDKKNDPLFDEKSFIDQFENATANELEFRIQVATHKFPENFDYTNLIGLPELKKTAFPDKITRFTIGNFSSLKNATKVLSEARKKGFPSAYIVAVYKGERYTLSELSKMAVLR